MTPLVSILIPVCNSEKYISQTINSALDQTYRNIEIIIVDDGSCDRSLEIVKKIKSPNIKILSQVNKGASSARNRALREAKGDFIQYMDSDDILHPDKIQNQIDILANNSGKCISTSNWERFQNNINEISFQNRPFCKDYYPVDWLVNSWNQNFFMHPAGWLLSREVLDTAGYWNEQLSLNDDGEYFCRVVLASEKILFSKSSFTYYRSGHKSLSSLSDNDAYYSLYKSIELSTNQLLSIVNNYETRYASAILFQRFIFEVYPDVKELISKAEKYIDLYGGCNLDPHGGPMYNIVSYLLGWKFGNRIKNTVYKIGYKRFRSVLSDLNKIFS